MVRSLPEQLHSYRTGRGLVVRNGLGLLRSLPRTRTRTQTLTRIWSETWTQTVTIIIIRSDVDLD